MSAKRYAIHTHVFASEVQEQSTITSHYTDSFMEFTQHIAAGIAWCQDMIRFSGVYGMHIVCVTPDDRHEIHLTRKGDGIDVHEFSHSEVDASLLNF